MKEALRARIEKLGSAEEKYNVAREFLQELILQIIDGNGYFGHLAFVGGTALRIIYDLPRFSEDLDFSLIRKKGFNFGKLLETLARELKLNGFEVDFSRGKDRVVLSEFVRFKDLLYDLGLSRQRGEKLFIKLEIDSNPPPGYGTEIHLINKDFLFKVQSFDLPSLFATKLHAFLFRKYAKGRDYYDLLWFLTRRSPVNFALLSAAAKQTEGKPFHFTPEKLKTMLLCKIEKTDFTHIRRDVAIFLKRREEASYFKKEYFLSAIGKSPI